ncbi:MAG: SMP-30/gluconolactonase/LRE family protein [Tannerella sp.]|jgi:sugar lactone lactonase YvrE|nr:SMP-30/gluconolactonase/LRE family protein [Tannerella sp.]
MKKYVIPFVFLGFILSLPAKELPAPAYSSIYVEKMEDELAVYFTPENFDIKNDGSADVSDALQSAINQIQETVRYGVVFIPEGRYRIGKTIYLWKGVRLIGYGKERPHFVLEKNTPGFQEEKKYLFHFVSDRSRRGNFVSDANAGTFYTGIRNINISIAEGNPSAIAVRFHAAQHCFLSHMDFRLSKGNIGVEDICNEIEYCRFFGGDYGIKTGKTSPGWQAVVLDCYYEQQAKAAIRTEEAGLMLIRNYIKQMPTAVEIPENRTEELWISDSRFENLTQPAILIGNENNSRTQINLENVICSKTPDFALFRTSGKRVKAPGAIYQVKSFTHGLHVNDSGIRSEIKTTQDFVVLKTVPPLVESDVPLLPANSTWANLKSMGAKGDGITDDTDILERAIASHQTIYLPGGHYRVTRPIVLKANTNLVGLHPSLTQIILRDSTAAYQGVGQPLPLLEAPKGGVNIVSGIGLNTAGVNPRAVAAKWMAGPKSMMNDVRFVGGHGTHSLDGREVRVYNDNRTADGLPFRKWDTQYWSLWITDGGGGTFKDIWTPSPYAAAGMYISNTSTEGRIYYMSVEHHVRNEVILDGVANWRIYGLQLELESGEGPYCLPLDIRNSRNLLFANTFIYRVSRVTTPVESAARVENSGNLLFKGYHAYTWTKYGFGDAVFDATSGLKVRDLEFAFLELPGKKRITGKPIVEELASGFNFIDGATVDSKGNVYFVDANLHRIYCWDVGDKRLKLISDIPFSPVSLACDEDDNLIAVSRYILRETVFSRGEIRIIRFDPKRPLESIELLEEKPFDSISGAKRYIYQSSRYRFENKSIAVSSENAETRFVTGDGKTILPNTPDIGQTYALKTAVEGQPFYVVNSAERRTYRCDVSSKGELLNPLLFAEEGEHDVAVDDKGNVYIPSGNISVYDREGRLIDEIAVPQRPMSVVFGGKDKKELYICARSALYRVRLTE